MKNVRKYLDQYPTRRMNDPANILHLFFEHAVCRRIRDHQCRKRFPILLCFFREIGQIDIALAIAFNNHHLHATHMCRSRIGAMGR